MTDPQLWARGGEGGLIRLAGISPKMFYSMVFICNPGSSPKHEGLGGGGRLFTEIPIRAHLVFVPVELKRTEGAFHC